jgi:hypothetical protein
MRINQRHTKSLEMTITLTMSRYDLLTFIPLKVSVEREINTIQLISSMNKPSVTMKVAEGPYASKFSEL